MHYVENKCWKSQFKNALKMKLIIAWAVGWLHIGDLFDLEIPEDTLS